MVSLDRSRIWMSGKYSTKFLSVHYGPNSQMTPDIMSFLSIMKNFAHLLGLDWAKAQHNSLAYNMARILC